MRLDFSWNEPLSDQTKAEIEEVANLAIRSDLAVSAQFMSVQQAKDFGAIALFGETYDEQVRVVQIGGPWSRELCGGTHVARSAQIGLVSVTGESSVGSGSRRIEALVGMDALTSLQNERNLVRRLASQLKVSTGELEQKVIDELSSLKSLEKQIATQRAAELRAKVPELASQAVVQGSLKVLSLQLEDLTADDLRSLALSLKAELGGSAVVILATISAGSATVIVAAGQEALAAGVKAGSLVSIASKILGGGGGGKPDLAQGGGTEIQSLQKALAAAVASI
jgi:alanyl-tRNA synthetase